ncbi:hypothetical protein I7I50_03458 [Histoplasma capsulatum G186AR]|uniref:Uncharacterized protein n=1 Tax=Ajellomyces capsulatus TaxID=5037 RepID=A0A8H8CX31_AJECA|nr:hypothetical protein I7I52_04365 [Histoplasma capsulatum]QSS74601.1 hypothetical protein I7I50_03458 [Histoplasma capsulatum G186AR]
MSSFLLIDKRLRENRGFTSIAPTNFCLSLAAWVCDVPDVSSPSIAESTCLYILLNDRFPSLNNLLLNGRGMASRITGVGNTKGCSATTPHLLRPYL